MLVTVRNLVARFGKIIDKHSNLAAVALSILIVVVFFINSLQIPGQVIPSDEIGYLSKAAAMTGKVADIGSSYYIGYSLFLIPGFLLFDTPDSTWRATMFINSVLWGVAFFLLFQLLKKLLPRSSSGKLLLVIAISSLYPTWIVMNGYALVNAAFAVVFIASLLLLMSSFRKKKLSLVLFGLTTGFLYWIHSIAIAFILPAFAFLFIRSLIKKEYKYFVIPFVAAFAMILTYVWLLHPAVNDLMTPDGYPVWDHYSNATGSDSLNYVAERAFWKRLLAMSAGQTAQLLVATFGVVGYAVFSLWEDFNKGRKKLTEKIRRLLNDEALVVMLVVFLSVIAAIVIGSASLLIHWQPQITSRLNSSHWLYARYAEMFVLPLIAVGLLKAWRVKYAVWLALVALTGGVMVGMAADRIITSSGGSYTVMPSFWPTAIHDSFEYEFWFLLGSAAILLVALIARFFGKKGALFIAFPLIVMQIGLNTSFHAERREGQRATSAFTTLINDSFREGGCIGFETDVTTREDGLLRLRAMAYDNLFKHDVRRMTVQEWLEQCEGPYITPYVHEDIETMGAKYVARERSSLFMVVREEDIKRISVHEYGNAQNLYVNTEDSDCVISGCFEATAEDLKEQTVVGQYSDGQLSTTKQAGVFSYGPYISLDSGDYYIKFDADVSGKPPRLRVLKAGVMAYLDASLTSNGKYEFWIEADVDDLEVVIEVYDDSKVILRGYEIKPEIKWGSK